VSEAILSSPLIAVALSAKYLIGRGSGCRTYTMLEPGGI